MSDIMTKRRHTGTRVLGTSIVSVLFISLLAAFSGPAYADSAVTAYGAGGIGVTVYTGARNYGNHTQYVGTIIITDYNAGYCDPGDPTEAWAGNVYYARTGGCGAHSFYINRSVPSGSGVCGSFYRYYNLGHTFPWQQDNIQRMRAVACITIHV